MSSATLRVHERRKSAGARLQSRTSLSQGSLDKTNEQENSPAASQKKAGIPELHARIPRRRVKSALETRMEQEASDIFHRQEKTKFTPVDSTWGVTKYSEDYGPKRVTPVPIRPISATRRNNPHPSNVGPIMCFCAPYILLLYIYRHL